MPDPIIPENQRNSFPLQTVSGAEGAEVTVVVGGQVQKYWGPSSSGIVNASAVNVGGGHIACVGNYLDMSGCINVALLLTYFSNEAAGIAAPPNAILFAQCRLTKSTVMPLFNTDPAAGTIHLELCGMQQMGPTIDSATGADWAATGAGATPTLQYLYRSWGPSLAGQNSHGTQVIGSDVRFILSFATNPVNAAKKFSLSVWGSS